MAQPQQRYRNPPLQEAVCEIFPLFERAVGAHDLEVMRRAWEDRYPQIQTVEDKQANVQLSVEGVRIDQKRVGQRLICRTQDGNKLVQLSDRFLAVNHLQDYPGWRGGFRDTILERFNELQGRLPAKGIRRIALRYIDRINVPARPMRWQDWFKVDLSLPESFQSPGARLGFNFVNAIGENLTAKLVLASAEPAPADQTTVIFDLTITSQQHIDVEALKSELERVHKPHSLAFESILQDSTRDLFDPIE
jgi:uncharacterized protein (TIGR04255 family)